MNWFHIFSIKKTLLNLADRRNALDAILIILILNIRYTFKRNIFECFRLIVRRFKTVNGRVSNILERIRSWIFKTNTFTHRSILIGSKIQIIINFLFLILTNIASYKQLYLLPKYCILLIDQLYIIHPIFTLLAKIVCINNIHD